MAEKIVKTETVETDFVEKAKGFWVKNSKRIIIAGTVLILLSGGYLGYKYFYKLPRELKASELIFPAEKLFGKMSQNSDFNKDSMLIVLNGGNLEGSKITGMLKIISSYGGTHAGNRARLIAGSCYLQLKEFDKAIRQLKEFDGNGADQIQSKAYILLGHAYSELKKTEDAFKYYKKAFYADEEDAGSAAEALFIAGRYAYNTNKTKEAIELFQKLKDKYPASQHTIGGDADKYLARLGVTK